MKLSDAYVSVVKDSALVQAVLVGLTMLVTDGGWLLHFAVIAAAAYWGGALLFIIRHPQDPTKAALACAGDT